MPRRCCSNWLVWPSESVAVLCEALQLIDVEAGGEPGTSKSSAAIHTGHASSEAMVTAARLRRPRGDPRGPGLCGCNNTSSQMEFT